MAGGSSQLFIDIAVATAKRLVMGLYEALHHF